MRNSIYLAHLEKPGDSSTATDAVFLPTIVGHTAGLHRVVKNGPAGYLTYGPYLSLPVGNYSFEISYSAKSQSENTGHWDVAVSEGVIAQGDLPTSGHTVQGCFLLTNPGPVQIRTFYNGSGKLTPSRRLASSENPKPAIFRTQLPEEINGKRQRWLLAPN